MSAGAPIGAPRIERARRRETRSGQGARCRYGEPRPGRTAQCLRLCPSADRAPAVPVHRRPDVWRGRARPLRLCGADGRIRRAAGGSGSAPGPGENARRREETAGLHRRRRDAGRRDRRGVVHGHIARRSRARCTRPPRSAAWTTGWRSPSSPSPGPISRWPRSPTSTTSRRPSARARWSSRGRSASLPSPGRLSRSATGSSSPTSFRWSRA